MFCSSELSQLRVENNSFFDAPFPKSSDVAVVQECCYCTLVNLVRRECSEYGCKRTFHHMCAIEVKGEENDDRCILH